MKYRYCKTKSSLVVFTAFLLMLLAGISAAEDSEVATPAYLYTLFDLEMLAPAEEILENSQPDEFIYFKAYKALKDCNQNFSIDLFIPHKVY